MKALALLQTDGRLSWTDLADHLGISGPAAAERVTRLRERGVIREFVTVVDPEAVGFGITAFVAVSIESPRQRASFLERIASVKEIQECHHVTGDDDYLLKLRCRNVRDLDRVINEEVKTIKGILRTRTNIVLRTSKETVALPLDVEKPRRHD